MISAILFFIAVLVALAGIVGCLLPVLPGPALSFVALLIVELAKNGEAFSTTFLVIMGAAAVLMTVLDYVVSMAGAKKYGASKFGLWGSVIGMLIGLVFFPPLGIFVGALLGAIAGEVVTGKKAKEALRVGWGVFIGNLTGIVLKLAYCLTALAVCIWGMF